MGLVIVSSVLKEAGGGISVQSGGGRRHLI